MTNSEFDQILEQALSLTGQDRDSFIEKQDQAVVDRLLPLLEADISVDRQRFLEKRLNVDEQVPTLDGSSSSLGLSPSSPDQTKRNATENHEEAPVIGRGETPVVDRWIGEEVGSYRVLEQIGQGGMGTVYLAQQRKPIRRQGSA